MDEEWEAGKERAWQRMWEDLEIGYLDTDILDVLIELFARPDSYPVSSCSGRIVVVDSDYPWERSETNLVFKKHTPVEPHEILDVMNRPFSRRLWLSVQGPIYHVYTVSIDAALGLLEVARKAGFKHSGILSCNSSCVVELRTGVRLAAPLADADGRLDDREIEWLVGIANRVLSEAKERNRRLLRELQASRPPNLWKPAVEALKRLRQV